MKFLNCLREVQFLISLGSTYLILGAAYLKDLKGSIPCCSDPLYIRHIVRVPKIVRVCLMLTMSCKNKGLNLFIILKVSMASVH